MKFINVLVLIVIAAALVMLVGGSLLGQTAEGYARGGGSVEARVLSPSTVATAGDNGVAIAIQGDDNSIALSYSAAQPTPMPEASGNQAAGDIRDLAGIVGFVFAAVVCTLVLYLLLFGSGGGKYR